MREDLRQLKTGPVELRKFGLLVGGVFALLGLYFWLRHRPVYPYLATPGILLMALGLLAPRALRHVYIGWMALAFVLGAIVSRILLLLLFFLVLTPLGLVAKCVGKDFLGLRLDRNARTYWEIRERKPKSPAEYERQY